MDKTKQGPIHRVDDPRTAEQRLNDAMKEVEQRNPKFAEKVRETFIQGTVEPSSKK